MCNERSSIFNLLSSVFCLQTRVRWPILWLALQGKGFGQVGDKKPHVLGRVDRDSRHEPPSVRWTLNFKPTVTRERPHQWEQHIRSTMWAINPTSLPRHKMKLCVNTKLATGLQCKKGNTTSLQSRLGTTWRKSDHKPQHNEEPKGSSSLQVLVS